ncbi:MAG TPA: tocopherol cyclase family protein [Spirochaetia bacterium]|nr:tocopherol cyclase family protein [Spirochaetia bacterium]
MALTDLFRLWNPPVFQGRLTRRTYFEGWYFKLVSRDCSSAYAIIAGIALGKLSSKSRGNAFIQIIDGKTTETAFVSYPVDQFRFSRSRFEISIAENYFSGDRIHLAVDRPEMRLSGTVEFSSQVPYPSTLFSPGAMGPYAFAPFMECYHGVVSMNHRLDGALTIGIRTAEGAVESGLVKFDGGGGYIEKDWGRSFPSSWIWMQSNHFPEGSTSIMVSIGRVPWLGNAFSGFMIVLWHAGRMLTFATYTGARLTTLSLSDVDVTIEVRDRTHTLHVRGYRAASGILVAPVEGRMERRIHESIDARIDVSLESVRTGELLYSGIGKVAGMEVAGNVGELISGAGLPAPGA